MNKNRKINFHTDSDTSMDQGFTLLGGVQSDNEDGSDKLMNVFDTKFIVPEEVKLTDNPDNTNSLRLGSNVPVVDKRTRIWENEKKPEENTPITWKLKIFPHSQENCLFEGRVVN